MEEKKFVGRNVVRQPLHDVVPLKMPFAITISPSDICNFRCVYCSQATEEGIKDARIISMEEFVNVADQLYEMIQTTGQKPKNLKFFGNGEPLCNKLLPDMIAYCVEKGMSDRYEVTTNGSLLTHEMTERLINAGLTRILISIQGVNKEKYLSVCGYKIDFEKFVEEISYFYEKSRGKCKVFIKTLTVALDGESDEKKFKEIFESISDELSVEHVIPSIDGVEFDTMISKEEFEKSRYGGDKKRRICCESLFMYMNIHTNGDVDACSCLYPPKIIGNLNEKPLKEIWNGKVHRDLMIKHLEGKRSDIDICNKCESLERYNIFEEDNLDPYLEEVLDKVKNM